jgi:hypothetical protein
MLNELTLSAFRLLFNDYKQPTHFHQHPKELVTSVISLGFPPFQRTFLFFTINGLTADQINKMLWARRMRKPNNVVGIGFEPMFSVFQLCPEISG